MARIFLSAAMEIEKKLMVLIGRGKKFQKRPG